MWRDLGAVFLAAAIFASASAGTATSARANAYTVWYCHDSGGRPVAGVERDWQPSGTNGSLGAAPVTCDGGFLQRTVESDPANPDAGGFFQDVVMLTPFYVTPSHLALWWNGFVNDGNQVAAIALTGGLPVADVYEGQVLADIRGNFGQQPDPLVAPAQHYALPGNANGLLLRAGCLFGTNCRLSAFAQFRAYRIAVTAIDNDAPQGVATGELVSDPVLTGVLSATVDATDKGAGLYAARVLVDGQVRATAPFGDGLCRDIDASNGDPFEFSSISPCPLHQTATLQLDAAALADDAYHRVQVEVLDAAGNVTTLSDRGVGIPRAARPGFFDPVTRRFLNPWFSLAIPRQLNGQGAGSGAIVRVYLPVRRTLRGKHGSRKRVVRAASRRTVSYAARPTLRARLTDAARRPIAGAAVWVASRVEGQEWQITGRPHMTSRTGRVGLRLPAGTPSRQLNVVYFPYTDSHEQAVGRPVMLKVRAGVTLSASRYRARNGQRVQFTGRVAGPLSPGGVTASLQVRLGRRYRSFRTLRVTPSGAGRFRTSYRFRATTRPTRYRFRVVVARQAGLPYERGRSATRSVVVRP